MKKMTKRLYLISVNGKTYDAIEIKGKDTEEIISKLENLLKKFMWLNYNCDLQSWEKLSSFHYHIIDLKSGTHYFIKLTGVVHWTEDDLY